MSCYPSSGCNGIPTNSSLQSNFSSCVEFCEGFSLDYFTLDRVTGSCACFESDECTEAVYLEDQVTSVLYTLNDSNHPCPSIPFTSCTSSNLTCDLSSATFNKGAVSGMQECVDSAVGTNPRILHAFYNPTAEFCNGFTAADCSDGLVTNTGYESAIVQYTDSNATCLEPCKDIDPDNYFKRITARAGNSKTGHLPGKSMRYTLTLVPHKMQPSPPLQSSLDLRVNLSSFLKVTKTHVKGDTRNSKVLPAVIDHVADTVTWEGIGAALLGVGSKRSMPNKLTFNIVATLASDIPKGADLEIEAYLFDEGNVCNVLVAETSLLVRDPIKG